MEARQYSEEKGKIWENVKHGLIYGSQDFVAQLKSRYLSDKKDKELPQHNSLFCELNFERLLKESAKILAFDIHAARHSRRIDASELDKRDLLIYFIWKTGKLSNREIGSHFGLTYSAVSRRVKTISDRISTEQDLKTKYNMIKSLIKV